MTIKRNQTWAVKVRDLIIGDNNPIAVQSMCATKTQDIEKTLWQINLLEDNGADLIRVAIDSKKDVEALAEIRKSTNAKLVVDMHENYRLVELLAPYIDKFRYNPGHLHHHEKHIPVIDKVKFLVDIAKKYEIAVRIGVNFGSLDPSLKGIEKEPTEIALDSVREHIQIMEKLKFENYLVSIKSSDPNDVIDINSRFAEEFPHIPLHLGVTEAGMLPMGELKSRIAFENLLVKGIGDTLRVSLTLPYADKYKEIVIGKKIVEDVYAGRFRSVPRFQQEGLNIISCPSCSRVENEAFVDLAQKVKEMAQFAKDENITIAVMGCRVNGPGETDNADLGLWCAPRHVNLKRKSELLGTFGYNEILPILENELRNLIANKK